MGIFVFKERKNFMKRTVSVFLVVLLACSIFVSASGTNGAGVAEPLPEMRTVTANGYTLTILEQVMENGQTVRTYHNPKANLCQEEATSTMSTENKQAKAEAILTALGMDEQYISDIPEDTLIESADCEQIVTTISHTKRDADGNVTYLADAEMAEVAATLAQKPEDSYENLYSDEYMTVTHCVYYYGDALFKFTTNARWRTMPVWRRTDSIGSCAPDIAIDNDMRNGVIRYTKATYLSGTDTTMVDEVTETITDIANVVNGDWYGSAGTFNLPNDYHLAGMSVTYTGFRAYYEYEAYVQYPGLETYFNSVGTYAHTIINVDLEPSITIGPGKEVSFSIGISTSDAEERRSAEILLHYVPG